MPGETDTDIPRASLAEGRSRREQKSSSKQNKFDQLRAAREKGEKIKYKVEEMVPVYDMIPEDEYAKLVSDRQTADQFVDHGDGADEYYDDGREIFDDEVDDESLEKRKKGQASNKKTKKGQAKSVETTDSKGKPALKQQGLADMFAASRTKQKKKEPESVSLDDKEGFLGELLDEMNSDLPEPQPQPRSEILFGSNNNISVDGILAGDGHDDMFKKSILRKKVRAPGASTSGEHRPTTPISESTAASSASSSKRSFPLSPPKKATADSSNYKMAPSKVGNAAAVRSSTGDNNLKRHKGAPPVASPAAQLVWKEESNDTSNASYEVDSTCQDLGAMDELDDGWCPDFQEETLAMAEPIVQQPVVLKPTPRLVKQIEKKWSMPASTPPQPAIEADMDSELSGMRSGSQTSTRIYWLDACEDLAVKGCVNLFGKIVNQNGRLVSVCVKVMNIQRQLFFLMRKKLYDPEEKAESGKDVEGSDVKQEFENSLMPKYRISGFRSVQRTKKYAFEKAEVPDSAEYLEVRYPFSDPILPEDLTGDSFSLVFGRNTSALEIFLLDRKVKGPCWLDILDAVPSQSKSTWCAEEFVAHSPAKVMLAKCDAKPPPIVIMALQLKIVVDPKTKHNDIVAVAAVVNTKFPVNTAAPKELFDFHFSIVAQDSRQDASRRFPRAFKQLIENNKKYNAAAVDSEKALLDSLLFRIQSVDPDLLVFHDAVGHNLDILLQRLVASMKGQSWSRLGRLKRSEIPKGRNAGAVAATGRLICDIKHSAEELIHNKSYDLTELVQVVLKDPSPRQEIESDFIQDMFRSNDTLERLIDSTLMDASYIVGIMAELNALPLALQITNIAGNVLSRTLLGGRSERNEFLLLHAFNARNYICPDKQFRDFHKKDPKLTAKKGQAKVKTATQADETGLEEDFAATALVDEEKENPGDEVVGNAEATQQAPGAKRKPTYAGGLVLDPKKGLYDSFVLLMDFNSLYPSIIQEYNICFTTIDRKAMANAKQEDYLPDLPDSSVETGVLPTEIKMLVERRQEVKKLIKQTNAQDVDKLIELDIRQKALKLTANSMYGCLGFNASRFFARPLAALVTAKGREILMNTKELIEKLNLEVIYGDTDSVMINTRLLDWDAVIKIGSEVKSKVDKHYKSLKLDVDGVFRSLLLLQKKKYAALVASRRDGKLVFTRELKGLDIVRRDWSQLAADTGKFVIDQILSDAPTNQPRDDVQGKILAGIKCVGEFMRSSGEGRTSLAAVFDNKYFVVRDELELYVITKALNKDPQFYADAKSLPHVQVAQRWNQSQPSRKLRLGSTVPYIICNEAPPGVVSIGGGKVPHTQRAYHIEEVQRNPDTLTVDRQYYLAEQVHKVVSRLCEPIDGVDSVTLAECLGIDRNAYSRFYVNRSAQEEDATAQGLVSDVELYKDCLPLTLVCPECRNNWTFDEPIWEKDEDRWLSLLKCAFCEARPFDYVIKIHNTLRLQIGLALQRYYKPVFVCQDVGCHYQCGFVPPKFHRGQPVCPKCEAAILKPEFSDRDLYLQLCYWKNAFDPKRALEKIKNKSWHGRLESAYNDPAVTAGYGMLTSFVQSFLDQSSYGRVNLSDFFPPPQPSVNISSLPASEF